MIPFVSALTENKFYIGYIPYSNNNYTLSSLVNSPFSVWLPQGSGTYSISLATINLRALGNWSGWGAIYDYIGDPFCIQAFTTRNYNITNYVSYTEFDHLINSSNHLRLNYTSFNSDLLSRSNKSQISVFNDTYISYINSTNNYTDDGFYLFSNAYGNLSEIQITVTDSGCKQPIYAYYLNSSFPSFLTLNSSYYNYVNSTNEFNKTELVDFTDQLRSFYQGVKGGYEDRFYFNLTVKDLSTVELYDLDITYTFAGVGSASGIMAQIDQFFQGGMITKVLRDWNPEIYPLLKSSWNQMLLNLNFDNFFNVVRYFFLYTFRQPATLVKNPEVVQNAI
ncbi:hypothetical protein HY498_03235 [Candidatus Woesearchaeota archaeon]|nr:hypothetical protein [Candidatus Woesearchaeota archaeon]